MHIYMRVFVCISVTSTTALCVFMHMTRSFIFLITTIEYESESEQYS